MALRNDPNSVVEKYIATYRDELAGVKAATGEPILRDITHGKHAGLAVLRFFAKPDGTWRVATVGRDDLVNAMKQANYPLKPGDEIIFSRYQFAIAVNVETGNRLIIDLGSLFGTGLADGQRIEQAAEFKSISSVGRVAFAFAAANCQSDKIHSDLNKDFASQYIDNVSVNISTSSKKPLPRPDATTGTIQLKSTFENVSWYPIRKHVSQRICLGDHGEYTFLVDADNSLSFGNGKAITLPFSESTYLSTGTKKIIYSSSLLTSVNPKLRQARQDVEDLLKELLADPETKTNYALKNALEEITQVGLIKMNGYPDSFKCPISLEVMKDPMIDEFGHSMDATNDLTKLRACPITNQNYTANNQFKSNVKLKRLLDLFFLARPDLEMGVAQKRPHASPKK